MNPSLPEPLLSQVEAFVVERMGLSFSGERRRNLMRGIASAAEELDFTDSAGFAHWLLAHPDKRAPVEILARHLTVGETYFFREQRVFEVLAEEILPELIHLRRNSTKEIKTWSAGCCTGEEAYSLAILFHKMIPDLGNWRIFILASDINAHFLQRAQEGLYTEWSFRSAPDWIKERFFTQTPARKYAIHPEIKRMVHFARLNLATDPFPCDANQTDQMDIILCRNVLMYLVPHRIERILGGFYHALRDNGWLIVSPSETSFVPPAQFETVSFPGVMLHRKRSPADRPRDEASTVLCRTLDSASPRDLFSGFKGIGIEPMEACASSPPTTSAAPALPDKPSPVPGGPPAPDPVELYRQGRFTELAEALASVPADSREPLPEGIPEDAFGVLVRTYADQGRLDLALSWCDAGISRNRLNPLLRFLRGVVLQEQGRLEDAVEAFKQAVYLDPNFVIANFSLAAVTRKLGRVKESTKYLRTVETLLSRLDPDETLVESDGLTAGRLLESVRNLSGKDGRS